MIIRLQSYCKNRKKRVAVDVDGTLADVMPMWVKIYNEKYNKNLDYKSITRWEFWSSLGISSREFFRIFSKAWSRWEDIQPTEENIAQSIEALNQLYLVDIVTGRTKDTLKFVKNWLQKHRIQYNHFVAVPFWQHKIHLPYDLYIDDSPDLAKLAARNQKTVLLYNQPWNSMVREGPWIKRINNLGEVVKTLFLE